MRILVISQHFYPENFRVNDLVVGLRERGHEVVVLTGLPNYPVGKLMVPYSFRGPYNEEYAGAHVKRVPLIPRGKGGALRIALNHLSFALCGILGVFVRLSGKFDAIFVFGAPPLSTGLVASCAKWRFKAPLLFWVLDLWPQSITAALHVQTELVVRPVKWLMGYLYKQCARVLVQSQAFVPEILAYGLRSQQIVYFPNWVEPVYTPLKRDEAKRIAALPEGFRIVFAGNIGAAQDFPILLQAAKLLKENKNIHWIISGDGFMAQWAREEVKQQNLGEQVHFLGQRPVEEMPHLFAQADVLLLSLKADPLFAITIPGKLQSYMACGRPVLAMLDGEGARIVQEAGAGFSSAAGDAGALATNVQKLMRLSWQERERLGLNGAHYAREHFNREKQFQCLEKWMLQAMR